MPQKMCISRLKEIKIYRVLYVDSKLRHLVSNIVREKIDYYILVIKFKKYNLIKSRTLYLNYLTICTYKLVRNSRWPNPTRSYPVFYHCNKYCSNAIQSNFFSANHIARAYTH